jgi:HD-GYP domain-containing protein (c-di-GMP phosphodiesterase class II)
MKRVKTSDIKLGMRFSSPVFFDDGINMFLAERKPITTFHLSAIENWKIPYVITYGKIISNEDNLQTDEILELEPIENQNTSVEKVGANNTLQVIAENLSQIDKTTRDTYSRCLKKVRDFFSYAKNNKNISRSEIDITIDEIYKLTFQDSMNVIGYIMALTPEVDLAKNALNSAIFASSLAIIQGFSKREILQLIGASLFHDIGMLSASEHIVQKKAHLSTSEYNMIKLHPLRSARFASEVLFFSKEVSLIIIQHHEYWNGTGYPAGLKEQAIEKGARILAIADAFSAMISKKSYRDSLIGYDAIKNLMEDTQKQFDPDLIQSFVKMMGAYPIGSIVLLNNGLIAQVVNSNPEMPFMPDVKILTEAKNNSDFSSDSKDEFHIGTIIKLKEKRNLCIIKVLHPDEYTL